MPRMRKGIAVAVAGLALSFLGAAFAVQEELLDQARKLVADAKPFVEKANDADLDMAARKEPRREAFKRLKDARGFYDKYLDANPSMEEKLDKEYVEMMVLLHGIKKDSALGDLEKDDDAAAGAPATPPAPDPKTPPANPPGNGTPAPPPAASPDAAERAKQSLAAIHDFEKAHPGDLPQIQKLYSKFLADFPDPAQPEYSQAADRLGKVTDRIKTVFQAAAKRDFDSLSGADTKDEKAFVFRLTTDLQSKDPDERRRAAQLLVASRSRSATYFLARGITDKDADFAKICHDGCVVIGGTTLGENLVKLFRDAPKEKQQAAMAVFAEAVKKGDFEAVNQSRSIGKFTLSNEYDVAVAAFDLLVSMKKLGGPGIVVALDSRDLRKRQYAMTQMAEAKYYKGAAVMAERFLVEGRDGGTAFLRKAANDAIDKMGVYAVPYLIDALHGATGRCTGETLSRLTGLHVETDEKQKVRDWWENHKPKDAE
jgi:hypothetical protein